MVGGIVQLSFHSTNFKHVRYVQNEYSSCSW